MKRNTRVIFGVALLGWVLSAADAAQPPDAFRLVPVDPLAKGLQSATWPSAAAPVLELDGAKVETVSGQVVLVPDGASDLVTASLSDLRQTASGAATIPGNC